MECKWGQINESLHSPETLSSTILECKLKTPAVWVDASGTLSSTILECKYSDVCFYDDK